MQNNFRKILKQSWRNVTSHPRLLILGVLSSLTLSQGVFEGVFAHLFSLINNGTFLNNLTNIYTGRVSSLLLGLVQGTLWVETNNFFLNVLIGAVIIFSVYLSILATTALVKAAHQLLSGKKTSIRKLILESNTYVPTVFTLQIISRIFLVFVFIATTTPLYIAYSVNSQAGLAISTFIFFILFIPLALITSFVFLYAINFSIIYKNSFTTSIINGWSLFRKNVLISTEIGLTLVLIKALIIAITIIVTSVIFIPLAILGAISLWSSKLVLLSILIVLASLILTSVYVAVNAFFATYYVSTWTILFLNLTEQSMKSKLVRTVESVIDYLSLKLKVAPQAIYSSKSVANKMYLDAKPLIKKSIQKATSKEVTESVNKINKEIKNLINKEKAVIIPTMKEVGATMKKDSMSLASSFEPELKKVISSLTTSFKNSFPNTTEALSKTKPATKKRVVSVKRKSPKSIKTSNLK